MPNPFSQLRFRNSTAGLRAASIYVCVKKRKKGGGQRKRRQKQLLRHLLHPYAKMAMAIALAKTMALL